MWVAESEIRLYGLTHHSSKAAIKSAYDFLVKVLQQKDGLQLRQQDKKVFVGEMEVGAGNPLFSKFAATMAEVGVDNLFFQKDTSYEDFEKFVGVLGKGPKFITANGGFEALMTKAGVSQIQSKHVTYVAVGEDQKVVARDAVIAEAASGKPVSNKDLAESIVKEVVKATEDQKWLADQIKNYPKKMAELISEGVAAAVLKAEGGAEVAEAVQGLLVNLKLLCESLMGETPQFDGLADAMQIIEDEVRSRSKKVANTEKAATLVNDILAVLTFYSDKAKAGRIAQEILKGDKPLDQIVKIIRALTPADLSAESFFLRIRDLLITLGVNEEQLLKVLEKLKRKPARKPRLPQALLDSILGYLRQYGVEESKIEPIAKALTELFDHELKSWAAEFRGQNDLLADELMRRDEFFLAANLGVVVWNQEGTVVFADPAGTEVSLLKKGDRVRWSLLAALKTADTSQTPGLTDQDRQVLQSVEQVVHDEAGQVIGIYIKTAQTSSQPPPA